MFALSGGTDLLLLNDIDASNNHQLTVLLASIATILLIYFLWGLLTDTLEWLFAGEEYLSEMLHSFFQELTLLGFLSMALFVLRVVAADLVDEETIAVFDLVHIALFAVALMNTLLLIFLIVVMRIMFRKWKFFESLDPVQVLDEYLQYVVLRERDMSHYFDPRFHWLFWKVRRAESYHSARDKFISNQRLMPEFKFNIYLKHCVKTMFTDLISVHWTVVAVVLGVELAVYLPLLRAGEGAAIPYTIQYVVLLAMVLVVWHKAHVVYRYLKSNSAVLLRARGLSTLNLFKDADAITRTVDSFRTFDTAEKSDVAKLLEESRLHAQEYERMRQASDSDMGAARAAAGAVPHDHGESHNLKRGSNGHHRRARVPSGHRTVTFRKLDIPSSSGGVKGKGKGKSPSGLAMHGSGDDNSDQTEPMGALALDADGGDAPHASAYEFAQHSDLKWIANCLIPLVTMRQSPVELFRRIFNANTDSEHQRIFWFNSPSFLLYCIKVCMFFQTTSLIVSFALVAGKGIALSNHLFPLLASLCNMIVLFPSIIYTYTIIVNIGEYTKVDEVDDVVSKYHRAGSSRSSSVSSVSTLTPHVTDGSGSDNMLSARRTSVMSANFLNKHARFFETTTSPDGAVRATIDDTRTVSSLARGFSRRFSGGGTPIDPVAEEKRSSVGHVAEAAVDSGIGGWANGGAGDGNGDGDEVERERLERKKRKKKKKKEKRKKAAAAAGETALSDRTATTTTTTTTKKKKKKKKK